MIRKITFDINRRIGKNQARCNTEPAAREDEIDVNIDRVLGGPLVWSGKMGNVGNGSMQSFSRDELGLDWAIVEPDLIVDRVMIANQLNTGHIVNVDDFEPFELGEHGIVFIASPNEVLLLRAQYRPVAALWL